MQMTILATTGSNCCDIPRSTSNEADFSEAQCKLSYACTVVVSFQIGEVEHSLTSCLQCYSLICSNWHRIFEYRCGTTVRSMDSNGHLAILNANRWSTGQPKTMKLSAKSYLTIDIYAMCQHAIKHLVGKPISKDTTPRRIRRPKYFGAATLAVAEAEVAEFHPLSRSIERTSETNMSELSINGWKEANKELQIM